MAEETNRLKEAHKRIHLQHLEKDEALNVKLRRLFDLYDTDSSGGIEFKEFSSLLQDLCIPMKDIEATRSVFDEIDIDQNGSINLKELTDWYFTEGKSIKKQNRFASTRLNEKKNEHE